jgi:hypothetical protein
MAGEAGRVSHLKDEVERYRSAAEASLQQLDRCVGYFARTREGRVAQALSASREGIRRRYLKRAGQTASAAERT